MRVLLVGGGGREHALAAAATRDPEVSYLAVAPGNPGIAELAELHAVDPTDPAAVTALAQRLTVDLVVIGPEAPLVAGVADALRAADIAVFGPGAAAAQVEGSKAFAKQVMAAAGVPTAAARVCRTSEEAAAALDEFGAPYVVKDDALAAGKGVVVTTDRAQALAHAASCGTVVIEQYLDGPEVSLFVITDGTTAVPLLAAQDFKRVGDADTGPNTGGMGAYAPLPWAPADLTDIVLDQVVHPTLAQLRAQGAPFSGLLYCGLALTSAGPKVIEFNARFGDPETQAILALLETPLGGLLHSAAVGRLAQQPPLQWRAGSAVTVVLAAPGYPEQPRLGDPIAIEPGDGTLFHAGTRRTAAGTLVTSGGRVLAATAAGPDLPAARKAAYAAASRVQFADMHYRRDIAAS